MVYAVETKGGKTRVYVLPITHTKPYAPKTVYKCCHNGRSILDLMTSHPGS